VRIYETTFIVNPQSDDASIDRQVTGVSTLITTNGGRIVRENRMGTRRLAYPIAGLTQGYYANFIFEGPASVLPVLERHYKLEDPFVRYLTVVFEGDPEKEKEAQEEFLARLESKEAEARAERQASMDDDDGRRRRGPRRFNDGDDRRGGYGGPRGGRESQ
jgi:small subunit ribosomal protein S6